MGVNWISQSLHVLKDMFQHQQKGIKHDFSGFHNAAMESRGSCLVMPSLLRPSCCWCSCRTRSKKHNGGIFHWPERLSANWLGKCHWLPDPVEHEEWRWDFKQHGLQLASMGGLLLAPWCNWNWKTCPPKAEGPRVTSHFGEVGNLKPKIAKDGQGQIQIAPQWWE